MYKPSISKNMTVLDVVSEHRGTEEVFRSYDARAGECICCNSLFETIEAIAQKYGLDLYSLVDDLEEAVHTRNG